MQTENINFEDTRPPAYDKANAKMNSEKISVAVLDTGVIAGQLPAENLFAEAVLHNDESPGNAIKKHGTLVALSVLKHAPNVKILPVQVTNRFGQLTTPILENALQWLFENYQQFNIKVVCAAFTDYSNHSTDEIFIGSKVKKTIALLRARGVVTVAAAGNWFRDFDSQGMGWPAILQEVISVGAIEQNERGLKLAEHTQRLKDLTGSGCCTTIFAQPEAPGDSSGATAFIAGKLAQLVIENADYKVDDLIKLLLSHQLNIRDENGTDWPVLPA